MNKEFDELVNEYEQVKTNSDAELERILSMMRQNLLSRVNNEYCLIDNVQVSIKEASFEELLHINGNLSKTESSETMERVSDLFRKNQLKNNQYSSNNPYPPKS